MKRHNQRVKERRHVVKLFKSSQIDEIQRKARVYAHLTFFQNFNFLTNVALFPINLQRVTQGKSSGECESKTYPLRILCLHSTWSCVGMFG